jgi:putrescine transport system ATP-binding protein
LIDGEIVVDDAEKTVIQSDVCSFFVGHGISGHLGMQVTVALRPEKIHLSLENLANTHNSVACTVESLSYFGSYTSYHLKLANGALFQARVTNTDRHHENIEIGQELWAKWYDNAMVVLNR